MDEKIKEPITIIQGIGEKKAAKFKKMNLETIEDIIYDFPREYEDRRNIKKISQMENGEKVLLRGSILDKERLFYKRAKKNTLKLRVTDETGVLEVIFFNAHYYDKVLKIKESYYFYGRIELSGRGYQMIHPEIFSVMARIDPIAPVYALTQGLTMKERRRIQHQAASFITSIEEYLPQEVILRRGLAGIQEALKLIHEPQSIKDINRGRYRLIFEELLLLQMGLLMLKNKAHTNNEYIMFDKNKDIKPFLDEIPFELTLSQKKVVKEIIEDMESPKTMNRLLQGDVGSGKTVVAAVSIFKAVQSGYQAVLMAPTEILARQHLNTFQDFFKKFNLRIALLTGNTSKKNKEDILEKLKNGQVDLLIGTHAVIQENVKFMKIGLVITDEQHRFGVHQRARLSSKGKSPDILVMTATPIPRTLALILYGDLDISIIHELPPNRKEIKTYSIDIQKRKAAYDFLLKEVDKGRQGYIVAPLIEESDTIEAESVVQIYEECKRKYPQYRWALMNGTLKQKEKDMIMDDFLSNQIQILISTVVIEVGVNVPNASVMIIENSERFGLAQLHQLRGRVGRGDNQSYCILISSSKEGTAAKRNAVMVETTDGFLISEKDLENRGPGDFFGTRQHGLPELKIANLFQHVEILQEVQKECKIILEEDPALEKEENQNFRKKIMDLFQEKEGFSF